MSEKLTRDKVLSMPTGPEMDALVAERVLGETLDWEHEWAKPGPVPAWTDFHCVPCGARWSWGEPRPRCATPATKRYSTDIAAAWEVVEHIAKRIDSEPRDGYWWLDGLGYKCCDDGGDEIHGQWRCWFTTERNDERFEPMGIADTAPLAICRAALLTTLEE